MKRSVLFYTIIYTILAVFISRANAQNFPFEVLDLSNFIASADSAQAINNNNEVLLGNVDGSLSVYDANNSDVFYLNPDPGYYFADGAGINDYGQITASQCAFGNTACQTVYYDQNYGYYDGSGYYPVYDQNYYNQDYGYGYDFLGGSYGYFPDNYGYDFGINNFDPYAYNDYGTVVGNYNQPTTTNSHAYAYDQNHGNVDLTCLLPAEADVILSTATDINNQGYIIGSAYDQNAYHSSTEQTSPYLFIPHDPNYLENPTNYCSQVQFSLSGKCRQRSHASTQGYQFNTNAPDNLRCKISLYATDTYGNKIPKSRFELQKLVGNAWQTISTKKSNRRGKATFSLKLSSLSTYRVYGPVDQTHLPTTQPVLTGR